MNDFKKKEQSMDNTDSNLSREFLISKALDYHENGNIIQAKKFYRLFIKEGYADPRMFSNYGVICKQAGKTDEAIEIYKKSIHLYPNSPVSYSNLGNLLIELGQLDEAKILLYKAIKIKPDLSDAYNNLANISSTLGQFKEAVNLIEKAIQINPNHSLYYYNLGNTLKELGKYDEAVKSIFQCIKYSPDYYNAYNNLGNILRERGRLQESKRSISIAIKLNPKLGEAYNNMGNTLRDLRNLTEAENYIRRAIDINPKLIGAYFNLGNTLKDLGRFDEAKIILNQAIEIDPDFASAYSSISTLNCKLDDFPWKRYLFSEEILKKQNDRTKIDIFYARSNISHRNGDYLSSANSLEMANKYKLKYFPSNVNLMLGRSQELFLESKNFKSTQNFNLDGKELIFIVGMPRSGSTLIESIISLNDQSYSLGEVNIFEDSYLNWKTINRRSSDLNQIYLNRAGDFASKFKIIINKYLYNYKYVGFIASQMPSAKIIHCYRNPLDNILSIYRANFAYGNSYTSSLVDISKIYLDQQYIMAEYKKQYSSKIYCLNYDNLVNHPIEEIKSLTNWLGWKWNNIYLSPHLNQRSVLTASNVQVRYPISNKSVGGWKNYKTMLQPAIDVLQIKTPD